MTRATASRPRRGPAVRVLRFFLLTLLSVLTLAAAATAWLLTPLGLQSAAALAQALYPPLAIESVEGPIWRARLAGVSLSIPEAQLRVEDLRLEVKNILLGQKRLDLALMSASGVTLTLPEKAPGKEVPADDVSGQPTSAIVLPASLAADRVALSDVRVCYGASCVAVDRFETAVSAARSRIRLTQPTLGTAAVTLPETEPSREKPLAQRIETVFAEALAAPLPELTLPIEVVVENFTLGALTLNHEPLVEEAVLTLTAAGDRLELKHLSARGFGASARAHGTLQFAQGGLLDLSADARVIDAPHGLDLALRGSLSDEIRLEAAAEAARGWSLEARLRPGSAGLPFDVRIEGAQPLPSDILKMLCVADVQLPVALEAMQLAASGDFNAWRLELDAQAASSTAPGESLRVASRVTGEKLAADVEQLTLAAAGSSMTLSGSAQLSDAGPSVDFAAQADLTDSGRLLKLASAFGIKTESIPVQISGKAALKGRYSAAGDFSRADLRVSEAKVSAKGTVRAGERKTAFSAQADLSGDKLLSALPTAEIRTLTLQAGSNRLDAKGRATPKSVDITAKLDIPDPAVFVPRARGLVTSSVRVNGPIASPDASVTASVHGFVMNEMRLQRAELSARLARLGIKPSRLTLKAHEAAAGETTLHELTLTATGTRAGHTVSLAAAGHPAEAHLSITGSLDEALTRWSGRLERALLSYRHEEGNDPETLQLDKPTAIVYTIARQHAEIAPHCWKHASTASALCAVKPLELGPSGFARFEVKALDLMTLRQFLPRGTRPEGSLTVALQASWTEPDVNHLKLKLVVHGEELNLRTHLEGYRLRLRIIRADTVVSIGDRKMRLLTKLALKNKDKDALKLDVTVSEPRDARALSGSIRIDALDLSELNALLSSLGFVKNAEGTLSADLRPAGTLEAPELFGTTEMKNVVLTGSAVPIDMAPSSLSMTFSGTRTDFNGTVASPEGAVNVRGFTDWADLKNPRVELQAAGENLSVVMEPYVTASVSADVRIAADANKLNLAGVIRVPRARLSATSIPESSVSVSPDEVLLDADMKPIVKKRARPMQITSTLNVELGEDVHIEAFGLKAGVAGSLTVQQNDDRLGLNGQLNLTRGRFQAYGQDLLIQKGEITFAGPVSDPILTLEAIRNPESVEDDVTVGIRVTGSTGQLQSRIFSIPEMDEAAKLSYLLRGQGLESHSDGNNMLSSALLSIGLSQSGQLISGLGQALSIRDLGVSTAGVGDKQQVVVSGYVLPGLQVKYAMGIFDSLSTITLRYRVIPRLYLEASSGLNQALDLLYSFEF